VAAVGVPIGSRQLTILRTDGPAWLTFSSFTERNVAAVPIIGLAPLHCPRPSSFGLQVCDAKPLSVEWTSRDDVERAEIMTWDEARSLIERVTPQADPPFIMEFFSRDSGRSLGLGIGRDSTVVTYQDSLDPPYFISLGDKVTAGTEWFLYGQEESEYLARNLVPMSKGLEALKEFVINRMQPANVEWECL
jgi:hypothetical protein